MRSSCAAPMRTRGLCRSIARGPRARQVYRRFSVLTTSCAMSHPFKPGRYAAGLRVPIPEYACAVGKVRYVGEPVAMVAAETRPRAEDAVELIETEYEPLSAIVTTDEAASESAPLIYDELGSNVAWQGHVAFGDVDRAFASADRIVRENLKIHRYSSTPLEPFACLAEYSPERHDHLVQRPEPRGHLRSADRSARHGQHPRDRPGYRRRLRTEDSPHSQVRRPHGVDGDEDPTAGEVDRGSQRTHDGRGSLVRPGVRRGGGRQGRRRGAGPEDPRHRRRGWVGQHVDDSFHEQAEQPVQHLQGAAPAAGGSIGAHEQVSGGPESRHRQARHVLHLGTDDGPHRAGARPRSDRGAAEEPDRSESIPVHDAERQHSRKRRLSGTPRPRAEERGL